MTSTHDKMESTIAAPDIHIAKQTVNDEEQCPDFLDCGKVGKEQYSGLTRFLNIETGRSEHHS